MRINGVSRRSPRSASTNALVTPSLNASTSSIHEAHLQVELRELRLPVRPQIFIAEAANQLEVPVETCNHQYLLEKLRRLGKRIELAEIEPARHDEIASALGRAFCKERRFDLKESL
jgi:hypothetical protein